MAPQRNQRHLVAILYADIVGFSRMSEADEENTFLSVRDRLDSFAERVRSNNGEVVKFVGDAVLAVFNSATDALVCAAQVQADSIEYNADDANRQKIQFRIGLNLGDIIKDRGDVFGDGVNVAARLEGLAKPGGICISGSFRDAIAMKLPFDYEFMGEQQVKNIVKPIRAYHASIQSGERVPESRKPVAERKPAAEDAAERVTSRFKPVAIAATLVTALVGGFLGFMYFPDREAVRKDVAAAVPERMTAPSVEEKFRIMVLPFKNLSDDADQAYFTDGITEDLIIDLAQMSGLQVLARNTSFLYKEKLVDHNNLRDTLDVSHIVEGSVRRSGKQIRVTTQLTDARTGLSIWSQRYDRKLDDIFAVQGDVSRNIVKALSLHLSPQEESALEKVQGNNIKAYDLFLQGQWLLYGRTREGNKQAQELFRASIEADPAYARSYGAWAIAKIFAVNLKWTDVPVNETGRALELAQRAVSLDPTSPHAYWALGFTHLFRKEYDQAEAAAKKAIQYAPNYADGYGLLSLISNHRWNAKDGIAYIERAISLNPHYTAEYLYSLGIGQYALGEYDKAIEYMLQALDRNPNFSRARMFLVAAYVGKGMMDEAEWEMELVLGEQPGASVTVLKTESAFADHPIRTRFINQLHQAGLPE